MITTDDPDDDYDPNEEYPYEQDDDYEQGYYSDGAYVSLPSQHPATTTAHPVTAPDIQTLYHTALLGRFEAHRAFLQSPPPANALSTLDSSTHPSTFPTANAHDSRELAFRAWRYNLRNTMPHPTQLSQMDTATILRLLKLLDGSLEQCANESKNIGMEMSCWIWGLLGRLEGVGQLDSTEVGTVRDLGKTAVWVGYRYRKMETETSEVPDANTLATLDLIITVAGELYGQRDLLQSRLTWEKG